MLTSPHLPPPPSQPTPRPPSLDAVLCMHPALWWVSSLRKQTLGRPLTHSTPSPLIPPPPHPTPPHSTSPHPLTTPHVLPHWLQCFACSKFGRCQTRKHISWIALPAPAPCMGHAAAGSIAAGHWSAARRGCPLLSPLLIMSLFCLQGLNALRAHQGNAPKLCKAASTSRLQGQCSPHLGVGGARPPPRGGALGEAAS